MFELKDVSKYYHNDGVTNRGLNSINLKLDKGEIVVITGESGSGKSTLLNVITKQDAFDEGEIYYYGNETSYFSVDDMDQFRKNKIGFIFQNYNIIDSYTVLENVMLPLIINDVPYKDAKREALEIIKKVGLEKWTNNRGTKLSGGQKQRCVIARALASRCEILACDEPTGNLDSQTGEEIVKLIKEVCNDKLVLIVTHNYDQFKDIATRKIKVHDGEIVEDIYVEKPTLEENKELNLDYVPVNKRTDTRIALNNLKSTPRKTFLMCIITLFTAFFAFFLYQMCYDSIRGSYKNNPLIYQGDNKIIAYSKLHNSIDASKFDDFDYVTNIFDENESLYFRSESSYISDFQCHYEPNFNEKHIKKLNGKMPSNPYELLLMYPSDGYDEMIERANNFIDEEFKSINASIEMTESTGDDINNYEYKRFKLVGVARSNKIDYPVVTSSSDFNTRNALKFACFHSDCKIIIGKNLKTKYYVSDSSDSFSESFFNYNNRYLDKYDIFHDIKDVLDESLIERILIIGGDIDEYENVYEVFLYGNESKIKSKLRKLDLNYIDASSYDISTKLERFLNNLFIYLAVGGMTLIILIVYLIASIILLRVFSSKMDTYAIFRTLGVTKKDMRKILSLEVFLTVISMTIFNLIIAFIFKLIPVNNFFFNMYDKTTFTIILIYLLIMIFIAYLLAKKFNKKLFKNTVSKTLREEE